MTKKLEGRVAVVTGASAGIGEATARALAENGADVVLVARRKDRLEKLAAELEKMGRKALVLALDVAKESDAKAVVTKTQERFGRLDILVNNAGVMLLSPIAESAIDDWRRMIDLNLISVMILTQAALPLLVKGKGHVINVSSIAGRIANPNAGAYAATKFGVVAFSESLRREVYKDSVRVTVVEPGIVATELGDHITNASMKEGLKKRSAEIEPLQAEDVAAAIAYAATQPPHVNVNEILLRPTMQER